jgi:putative flippase GtrA
MKIMPEAEAPSARDSTAAGPRSAPGKTGTGPASAPGKTGTGAARAPGGGERYVALMAAIVRRLPFGLDRVVAPNLLGFAVINLCTFSLDLALLTALHGGLGWPVPVSITLSYVTASGVSYVLNRSLNFRSHGALGTQTGIYAVVITVNYLAWILGVGAGLAALGVNYQLARVAAGLCEAAYMYVAMRWLVFRDTRASVRSRS